MSKAKLCTCICCSHEVKKTNDEGFCSSCRSNKDLTITTTNVKKIYGLTEEDLQDDSLHSFTVKCRQTVGRKYIISEIDDLVQDICANTDDPKKKKKLLGKLNSGKKTAEINKFIKQNIANFNSFEIYTLAKEYIDSNVKSFKDASNEIIKADDLITKNKNSKKLFESNLAELQPVQYLIGLVGARYIS